MAKHLSKDKWIKIFDVLKESGIIEAIDNRKAEYFFSCLKKEFLKQYNTNVMSFNKIYKLINEYSDWYNTQRIQSILGWKTPAEASGYVI